MFLHDKCHTCWLLTANKLLAQPTNSGQQAARGISASHSGKFEGHVFVEICCGDTNVPTSSQNLPGSIYIRWRGTTPPGLPLAIERYLNLYNFIFPKQKEKNKRENYPSTNNKP